MISCAIAFQVNGANILLDSSFRTPVEETIPTACVDASKKKNYFHKLFLVVPFLVGNKKIRDASSVPMRKAVLEETYLALGRWLACCLACCLP
jgi:hypothetical protein